MARGRLSSQIIEIARDKIEDFDRLYFGKVVFSIRYGSVYRISIESDLLVNEKQLPKDVLQGKTKEELIDLILGKGGT